MFDVNDFLEHYGKKGMKWGVRKHKGNVPKISNDAKRAAYASNKIKKGGVKALSNNEIRDLAKRLQLEQQLNNLVPKKKSKIKAGLSFTKEVINTGDSINKAMAFSNSPAGAILKKQLGIKEKPKVE